MNGDAEPVRNSSAWREPPLVIGFLVAAAVLIAVRFQGFDLPLETDEANYAYIGGRLLQGDRLYIDVWDHQPFGVYAWTAALIALLGDAPVVFRWSATAASLISLGLIMSILRRICCRRAAVVGAFLFAVVCIDPGTGGEGCNREIYMNPLILAAWTLVLCERRRRLALLSAGICLGTASTFKTIVAVHWVLLAVYVLWQAEIENEVGRASKFDRLKAVVLLGAGPFAIWAAGLAYFAATARFPEFVDAVFRFNLGYAESGEPFWMRFARFFAPIRHRFVFESAFPLWIAAAIATVGVGVTALRRPWDSPRFVWLMVLAAFLATCLPGRFWPHYYYLLIPPSVIVVAYSVEAFAAGITAPLGTARGAKALLGWGIVLLIPLLAGIWETRYFLLQSDFGKTVKRYNSRDFWGAAQGVNVKSVTEPGDSIFVWGNDAAIYYYSGRRCASRYTMITGLGSGMPGVELRRRILLEELEQSKPRVILVLFDEPPFEEWKAFLHEHYSEPVGFDYHDTTGEAILFVVARKDEPIRRIDWDWDRSSVGGWDPNRKASPLEISGGGR